MPDRSTDGTDWDPADYDDDHSYVYEYGAEPLERLVPSPDERVLDLGCGTGHLTASIAAEGADAVGLDASAAMVAAARRAHDEPAFVHGDARALPFGASFDAVFSNAALHWIPASDQDTVLAGIRGVLGDDGRFVAELGAANNVGTIVEAVHDELSARGYPRREPWYFPTLAEYVERLSDAGFAVEFARTFDRPTDLGDGPDGLANWLETFGDDLLAPVPDRERPSVVDAVADRLRPDRFEDGTWVADYRRLRFAAVAR